MIRKKKGENGDEVGHGERRHTPSGSSSCCGNGAGGAAGVAATSAKSNLYPVLNQSTPKAAVAGIVAEMNRKESFKGGSKSKGEAPPPVLPTSGVTVASTPSSITNASTNSSSSSVTSPIKRNPPRSNFEALLRRRVEERKRRVQLQGGAVGNNDSVQTIDSIMSVDETLPKRRAEGVSAPVAAASAANRSEDGLSLVSSSLSTGSSLEELTELEDEDVDESMEVFESVSNDGNVESDG